MATKEWKLGFCECTKEIGPCILIFCCGWLGVGIVQFCALKNISSQSPSPIVGLLATCCCGCLGAAWARTAIRKQAKMSTDYWTDCAAYNGGCLCCMAVQELYEFKENVPTAGAKPKGQL